MIYAVQVTDAVHFNPNASFTV